MCIRLRKKSNIFLDFFSDFGNAIVESGKKAVDTVVDVGKYVGEKVVEYPPTVGTFIVENAPVLSNIKSGADFLFGVDVLTGERLSSTDRTLAFFETFTSGGVQNLAESGFKNGSKFLNNLTPTVTRNVNKGIDNAIPNFSKAKIDPRKLTDYALNPNHPVGGNKAKVFESALGYNQSNASQLMKQIQKNLPNTPATLGKADQYGQRYTVDMLIKGPNGKTATVRTGWIIKSDSNTPEMTTLFVK